MPPVLTDPATDPLQAALERVVARAGTSRIAIHRLPDQQWSLTLFHEGRDAYRAYHGDTLRDCLDESLEDPGADLRWAR